MGDALISVVVPIYNVEKELERCVKSIIQQSYPDLEIILVDDGSTDNSQGVIKELAAIDSRIVPIFKENGGVTSARLAGVERASGDWIGFVDGDDEIEPEMYERLLANAVKYSSSISHCGYQMIFPDGRVHFFYNTGDLVQEDRITALRELLSGERIEPGLGNKLFQKDLFCRLLRDSLMDTSIKNNEDLLMNFYLFREAERSVFEDWCPYKYIVRDQSASRRRLDDNKVFDPIKVKQLILDQCEDDLKPAAGGALLRTCIYSYCGLITAGERFKAEERRVRKCIAEYSMWRSQLSRRSKLIYRLITDEPHLFRILYRLYWKYFQKKQYQ